MEAMSDYLGWIAFIILVCLIRVYSSYRRNQFRAIKREYGVQIMDPYTQEELTRELLAFNQKSSVTLGIRDSALINIDGSLFPLVHGSISYIGGGGETLSVNSKDATFLVVQGSDFADLALKYRDIFEFGAKQEGISVFWVKDLQRLITILRPTGSSIPT